MNCKKIGLVLAGLLIGACGVESGDEEGATSRDAVAEAARCGEGGCGKSEDRGPARDEDGRPIRGGAPRFDEASGVCTKIEDAEIGASEIVVELDGIVVEIEGWIEKGDSPGEQIGFDWIVTGGDVDIRVKTGGETYEATLAEGAGTWSHPNGTEGPEVPAISHIVFCGVEDGSEGEGGDEGEGGEGGSDAGEGGEGGTDFPPIG